ncbi:aromatic ring-hydroxylating dioxygenase subunit alpha [Mesorhizobium sp. M7A.F.Ca.US.006.04.2.1]|uniref:aromatic ring-hydroxylating oxygenase subunit alpha n=1 Tax=unclassified Mesorhizobium TaxID=325217 RepID=UPI000FCCB5F7|nr:MULTISPECIES: aromatic ring-hydroxylating dioxygenase subunit alpha [unclassified Mesorhizobium]MDF3156653.1 aromatic ring-hydroxylating dioxygenase subunit alpha [Mesorhizobium sp. XAP10]MDF3249544.1 aromatic ring-hydroxylating dioxygenase subunit alpha [Mesorhizobium sp. XAP4]RUX69729.1 aromatic ring-hydroxylating dioxygenase subunit alpha [Mesorhizobium sp. M7A.F.Ca.US.005.03.1.1]RUY12424.1 aromatic ring-hydroxylating dioxygenase subunit alpha [Mesorhizobium sp. M7A.F.Ca.US.005.03.2.1]RU
MATRCVDRELLNDWHIVADQESLSQDVPFSTRLLGVDLVVRKHSDKIEVVRNDTGDVLKSAERYGFVWTCLDKPWRDIIYIPEANEADRHLVSGGSIAVKVSGLRAVENFLDMGHFPFIHTGWLGEEPHTEVVPYKVEITPQDEVLATECKFYQPIASPTAKEGFVVEYIYKVIRPYTVALYKSNPIQKGRLDVITLFVQPVDEENCVAHPYLCYLKEGMDAATVRSFMQLIFAQDKPILENQVPKRLPLDPRAETPIRADAVSVSYRRWLRDRAVTYGAIPAQI